MFLLFYALYWKSYHCYVQQSIFLQCGQSFFGSCCNIFQNHILLCKKRNMMQGKPALLIKAQVQTWLDSFSTASLFYLKKNIEIDVLLHQIITLGSKMKFSMVQLLCPQRKLKIHHEVLDQAQLSLLVFQVICLQKSLYLCC